MIEMDCRCQFLFDEAVSGFTDMDAQVVGLSLERLYTQIETLKK